jgi:NTP pyrophosphatase (non-canonical NTP hydrolase)
MGQKARRFEELDGSANAVYRAGKEGVTSEPSLARSSWTFGDEDMWEMQERIARFDSERFQSLGPGYLALSIAGEAGELANVMKKLWRKDPAIGRPEGFDLAAREDREQIGDEIADIVMLCVVLANHLQIDVEAELERKLKVIDDRLQRGYYGAEGRS